MFKINNFEKHLQYYYETHYAKYADHIKWYPMAADNKWKFRIPELRKTVVLTCDGFGNVTERVVKG